MQKMDLNIGNILYIVITLVAVILGLAGKKKKRSPSAPQDSAESSTPGFMENLENLLKMGEQEPVVSAWQEEDASSPAEAEYAEEMPAEEPFPEYREKETPFMQEYESFLGKELETDPNRIREVKEEDMGKLEVIDLDAEEGTSYFNIVRDFDAQTAVIYAAIINRIDY